MGNPGQRVLYYLIDGPKRAFVREELMQIPEGTEMPPEWVEKWWGGEDVAVILGYSNTNKALLENVEDEDRKYLRELNPSQGFNYNEGKAVYINGI